MQNVYGNVLVFGKLLNENVFVLPTLIYSDKINSIIHAGRYKCYIFNQIELKKCCSSEGRKLEKSYFSLNVDDKRETYLAKVF